MRKLLLLFAAPLFAASDYVDPAKCQPCHRQIYDRYLKTPMGRSFYPMKSDVLIEGWNQSFYHAPSDRHYRMLQRDGQFFIKRFQKDPQGREVNTLELMVTHVMGSGARARSYLHLTAEGRLIELPVSWYTQKQQWAMAPGYDRPDHPDFSRTINHKCMFCHNAYPQVPEDSARQGRDEDVRFATALPNGINCQRCHGPGGKHVQLPTAQNISNPARLDRARQLEICMQCHLETTTSHLPASYRRFGRGFYSYRPGEPLSEYILHFDHAPGTGHDDKFEIVSAAYRLRQSSCFRKSDSLTCTTCHDPHTAVAAGEAAAHYRARCLGCHPPGKIRARHSSTPEQSDCIGCHMPLRRTEDVVHVALTDHRIQRLRLDRDLLAPLSERHESYRGPVIPYYPESVPGVDRDVYLGIAQVKDKANLQRGSEMLSEALARSTGRHAEPWFELAEAQAALGKTEAARQSYRRALQLDPGHAQAENNLANLLSGAGKLREAVLHYRRSLSLEPLASVTHNNLGLTLLEMGDRKGAAEAFASAVKANPLEAAGYVNAGSLLLLEGRLDEAQRALEKALAIEPSSIKARNNLGLLLLALGRHREAVFHLGYVLRHGTAAERQTIRDVLRKAGVHLPDSP